MVIALFFFGAGLTSAGKRIPPNTVLNSRHEGAHDIRKPRQRADLSNFEAFCDQMWEKRHPTWRTGIHSTTRSISNHKLQSVTNYPRINQSRSLRRGTRRFPPSGSSASGVSRSAPYLHADPRDGQRESPQHLLKSRPVYMASLTSSAQPCAPAPPHFMHQHR
jgi:hypothetical protein